MAKQNPLEEYFRANDKKLIHKWIHYFDIYHRHFERFRGKRITVVEFGVSHGGSLQMWRKYFGRKAKIYGIDINPECVKNKGRGIKIFIGDQSDREFLRTIAAKIGPIDVLIEDGGHHPDQQIATFEEFYPQVKSDGVFLIEDLHTSYWPKYSGGLRRPGTFIEYAKGLMDDLNAFHSRSDDLVVTDFTKSTRSMHVYDSIIVFEKGEIVKPRHEKTGNKTLGV